MIKSITKVKTGVKEKVRLFGWEAVLADLKRDELRLQSLVSIVERKIKKGEPWPGTQSENQTSDSCHSV